MSNQESRHMLATEPVQRCTCSPTLNCDASLQLCCWAQLRLAVEDKGAVRGLLLRPQQIDRLQKKEAESRLHFLIQVALSS